MSDEVASIGDELQSVGTSFAELKDAPRLGEIIKWMATSCKAQALAEILPRAFEDTLQPLVPRPPLSLTAPDFLPLIELISADAYDHLTILTQIHALEALESLFTLLPCSSLAPQGVPSTDIMTAVTDAGCLPLLTRKLRSDNGDLALAACARLCAASMFGGLNLLSSSARFAGLHTSAVPMVGAVHTYCRRIRRLSCIVHLASCILHLASGIWHLASCIWYLASCILYLVSCILHHAS